MIFNGSEAVDILAKLIHRPVVPDIPISFSNYRNVVDLVKMWKSDDGNKAIEALLCV